MSRLNKPLIGIIALMAMFSPFAFSFSGPFSDDFQGYGTSNDALFLQRYLNIWHCYAVGTGCDTTTGSPAYYNTTIVQAPSDSLTMKVRSRTNGGNVADFGFMVAYNYSIMNTSQPFTLSELMRYNTDYSTHISHYAYNQMHLYFYIFANFSPSWNTSTIENNLNTTRGYLLDISPSANFYFPASDYWNVQLSRCSSGLTIADSNMNHPSLWTCPQILGSAQIMANNNTGWMAKRANVGDEYDMQFAVVNGNSRLKVAVANNNTIYLFMTNDTFSYDSLRFSYQDTAPLFNLTGGIIQRFYIHSATYNDHFFFIDDLSYTNSTTYTMFPNLTMVSYPQRVANKLTFVEMANNTIANWIAVNLPFDLQLSFDTPSGEMNSITDVSCPVRLFGEERCDADYCYMPLPIITAKASTPADAGKCLRRIEYNNYQSYIYTPAIAGVPIFCYGPEMCLWTWGDIKDNITIYDQVINNEYVGSGAWNSAYKVVDYNGKWLYRSVDYVCSSPANLTFAIQYFDKNTCAGQSGLLLKLINVSIGINPDTNISCDYQANASCFNGSTNIPATPLNGSGNHTLFCELHPTDAKCLTGGELYCQIHPEDSICITGAYNAGITDIYNPDQSGGIVGMIMSPAFIGMMVCVIVGSAVGFVAGPLVGVCGFIGAIIISTGFGLFPIWISFAIIALTAFATASLIKAGFTQ